MAFDAAVVWEVRPSGINNNGGGWHDTGGASTDYSQQDAAQENWSNLSISSATLTDDDTGGLFTDAMVGNIINVITVGRFEVIACADGNNVTLDHAPGDAAGLTGYLGGAVADLQQIDGIAVAGNDYHVRAGTYTTAGNIYFSLDSTGGDPIRILGYNTVRGDNPTGDDRPLLDIPSGSWFRTKKYFILENLRIEGIGADVVYFGSGFAIARNCYVRNTSGIANRDAFYSGAASVFIDCEAVVDGADAFGFRVGASALYGCLVHGDGGGMWVNDQTAIEDCIFDDLGEDGVHITNNDGVSVVNCTFYSVTGSAVYITSGEQLLILNNQFMSCGYGIRATTPLASALIDYNNYFTNITQDVSGVEKGANATANDPGFTDAPGGDFSGVDDAEGFDTRLGVG